MYFVYSFMIYDHFEELWPNFIVIRPRFDDTEPFTFLERMLRKWSLINHGPHENYSPGTTVFRLTSTNLT